MLLTSFICCEISCCKKTERSILKQRVEDDSISSQLTKCFYGYHRRLGVSKVDIR